MTHSLLTTRLASASLLFMLAGGLLGLSPAQAAKGPRAAGPQEWLEKYYLPLPAPGSAYAVYPDAQAQSYADEVFRLTNTEREKKGHTLLRRNPQLDAVAQAHAIHMAQARFFEHESPLGMEVFERLDAAGSPHWNWAGENIAAGYRTPEIAVKEWMDSKGHRKNIRNEEYREIGIGVYYDAQTEYRWFWVQVFATFDGGYRAESGAWLQPGGGTASPARFQGNASEGQPAAEPHEVAASSARGADYAARDAGAPETADPVLEIPAPPADELELEAADDGPNWEEAQPLATG